ncbi:hypothetical protein, partial [Chromohalobacter sp. HP20-39]|uniref:hypothetical protein n=1 Tax=Chromohalobacter sp. HP20-39 TaxID=3079306 RepID=UPI00294B56BD
MSLHTSSSARLQSSQITLQEVHDGFHIEGWQLKRDERGLGAYCVCRACCRKASLNLLNGFCDIGPGFQGTEGVDAKPT